MLDEDGVEQHRIEGFLPADDFITEIEIGLAKVGFAHRQYAEAERIFRAACHEHPASVAAPEACYWAGVSAYKATHRSDPLRETARLLESRYPDSEWARKASVWKG